MVLSCCDGIAFELPHCEIGESTAELIAEYLENGVYFVTLLESIAHSFFVFSRYTLHIFELGRYSHLIK